MSREDSRAAALEIAQPIVEAAFTAAGTRWDQAAEAMVQQLANWIELAKDYAEAGEFYRQLLVETAQALADDDLFIADDGSVQDAVLLLKIPESAAKQREELQKLRRRLAGL